MPKPEIEAIIKETAYLVNQATKQENSGLMGDVKSMIKENNANLALLLKDFQDHKAIVYAHFESDKEWKASATPVIDMGKNVQGFGKVSLYVIGFVASVTGAIIGLLHLTKK